jgi:hypothetical protein
MDSVRSDQQAFLQDKGGYSLDIGGIQQGSMCNSYNRGPRVISQRFIPNTAPLLNLASAAQPAHFFHGGKPPNPQPRCARNSYLQVLERGGPEVCFVNKNRNRGRE